MTLDESDIEQIAHRVAELVGRSALAAPAPRFVDAAFVARLLSVERDWVYEHAAQLGGIRLGGPRGRLRFDRETLPDRLAQAADPSPAATTPSGRIAALAKRPRDGATPPGQDTGRVVPMPKTNRTHAGRPVV
jgi:hypothetical protein